jgi:hypothetical protein
MLIRYYLLILLNSILFFSCGTPNDPESIYGSDGGYKIISRYKTPGYAQDIVVKDSLAFIAQGQGGLIIFNISNPYSPKFVSQVSDKLKGYSNKIALKDKVVFLSAGNFGVSVVNINKPYLPDVTATNLQMKPAINFHIMNNYLFTTVGEYGVAISEISIPTLPDIRGSIITSPGFIQSVCATNDGKTLLAACGEMGVSIIDISDWQNGFGEYPLKSWIDLPGFAEDIILHPTLPVAFLACGIGGLQIIDFADTTNIKILSSSSIGGYAKEIKYDNNKVFVTTELRGLQIFDVSNLSSPTRVATVKSKYPLGIALDSKYIYLADEDEGLVIVARP